MVPDLPLWLQDLSGIAALVSAVAALVAAVRATGAARDAGKTAAQVSPNGGSTMRDSVSRTEADVAVIRTQVESLGDAHRSHGHQLGEIKRDLDAKTRRHDQDVQALREEIRSRRPDDACP